MYKGIEKNQNYTWLICAAQNMKNIVTKITKKAKKKPNNEGKNKKHNDIIKISLCFYFSQSNLIKIKSADKIFWTLSTL